ncbi:TIGR03089 family protein [Arthrobacter cheniae]|nr:TIGR03089 family protein [Arthrobacter cheniae]
MPRTPAGILAHMRSVSASSPRLVWHGADGRIELSGRVFDNWVAKGANLLVDELDASDETAVAFDLPVHWKTLALAFACWQVGAVVVLDSDSDRDTDDRDPDDRGGRGGAADVIGGGDIILSSRAVPGIEPPRQLVCVALGSLAMRWDGPLPPGAIDFAAEVRSHGDVFFGSAADSGDAPLVSVGGRLVTGAELLDSVTLPAAGGVSAHPATVLLEPGSGPLRALAVAIAVWQDEGTLVIVDEGVPVTESMMAGERITCRLGPA